MKLSVPVFLLLPLLLTAQTSPPQETAERQRLSFEQTMDGGVAAAYRSNVPGLMRWSSNGRHLAEVRGNRWIDPAEWKEVPPEPEKVAEPSLSQLVRAAIEKARDGKKIPEAVLQGRPSMSTLPRASDQPGLLVSADKKVAVAMVEGELWAWREEGGAQRVLGDAKNLRRLEISPDGRHVSYVRGFDLYVAEVSSGRERALSSDGSESLFYGELDWVYQEEVYGRFDFKATWWSPAGGHLAYLRIDESDVAEFTVVDHIPYRLEVERLRYPKAGDGNPKATLHLANAATGAAASLDLSKYAPEEQILIVRVTWSPDGERVVFQVQDREQRWLDLNFGDPETGEVTTAFREESKTWVNVLGQPHWLKDGGFLWESERTGYKHLYRYDRDGTLRGAVTEGEWQVGAVEAIDEAAGHVTFSATKDGALDLNYYRVGLDGKGLVRLTQGPGTHAIAFNADRTLFLDTVSSLTDPGEQRLCRADGTVVRTITKASLPPAASRYGLSLPELVSVKARDGYELDATILKPHHFDPERAYPVWISTYSGPDAPTVKNRWSVDPWTQFLAQEGYLQLSVNVRSASGRGQKHTETCYRQFGVQELLDLEDAVAWLTAHPWADAARVGITGWSYGGFMAAYALTHSKAFKLGIAGGGVYDWRDYDTIYTERYMQTPQNNPEGYRKSSCIPAAPDLHGHLLIVHGAIDDNVHLQNAMQLSYALQRAGKDFDMMIYPKTRHGFGDAKLMRHFRALTWKTIQEHLGPGANPAVKDRE